MSWQRYGLRRNTSGRLLIVVHTTVLIFPVKSSKFDRTEIAMTTIELKKQLIEQISKVDDVSHLEAIKTLLDTKMVRGTIILSDEQRAELKAAQLEAENGAVYTDEEVDKEIRAWLRAK